MLIGILSTAAIAWSLGLAHFAPGGYTLADLSATAFRLDVPAALNLKRGVGWSLVEIVFVFLFVDMFDNVGTLVAVTKRAGLVSPDGSIPRLNRILLADSASMLVGAVAGTSPVTSYIESAAGVAVGGRTGLTSVVVGILFLAHCFLRPWCRPSRRPRPRRRWFWWARLMMGALAEVEWPDPGAAIPAFLTVIMIPLTYSIANGLAFGITSHAVLKLVRGQARVRDWLVYVLAALCVVRFIYLGLRGTHEIAADPDPVERLLPWKAGADAGAAAPASPLEVKVLIINMFSLEAAPWLDALKPTREIRVPGLSSDYPVVKCTADAVCEMVTGMGHANAAASMMAVLYSGAFDLRRTYMIIAGIAGMDPERGTIGSAAWARYLVDGGIAHEIDAREMPHRWQAGYFGVLTDGPGQVPRFEYRTEVFRLDEALLQKALSLSKSVALEDSEDHVPIGGIIRVRRPISRPRSFSAIRSRAIPGGRAIVWERARAAGLVC